ncbi:uncharacterized protein [Clinocottus analis]|uniref:uncharacterized protein n=1 Tax=Clinocottus analis TaxID=304258 RepID=UPI0035C0C2DF
MTEKCSTNYQSLRDTEQEDMTVSWDKFFVHVAGKTNDAHLEFVDKFRGDGRQQVKSPGESDFLLVFCPVVSRVGTDINVALQSISDNKPVILVVMHHTFDHERVIAASRRQVENPNVKLTVDCLFHEGSLLKCELNNKALSEVKAFVDVPRDKNSKFKQTQSESADTSGFSIQKLCQWWSSWWHQEQDGSSGAGEVVVVGGQGGASLDGEAIEKGGADGEGGAGVELVKRVELVERLKLLKGVELVERVEMVVRMELVELLEGV